MAGAAERTVAGRRGKGGGGVPRRARRSGAAARMVAGLRGEPGARARRRGWVRGATAGAVAGAAASVKAERSGGEGEREGGSRRRKERGWVGERERKGWREEGEMHER